MTREQAQSLIQSEPKAWEVIDEIYNDFEEQLANLNSNLEAQEIMIADYKKRIEELEAPKTCETCKHYDGSYECNNANSIAWETSNRVYPDDYCKDYEPKGK